MNNYCSTAQITAADKVLSMGPCTLDNYTVLNGSAAAVTINFCDDKDDSLDTPIESVTVPAHSSFHAVPRARMLNGLNVNASS